MSARVMSVVPRPTMVMVFEVMVCGVCGAAQEQHACCAWRVERGQASRIQRPIGAGRAIPPPTRERERFPSSRRRRRVSTGTHQLFACLLPKPDVAATVLAVQFLIDAGLAPLEIGCTGLGAAGGGLGEHHVRAKHLWV